MAKRNQCEHCVQRFADRSTNGGIRARRARGSANLAACKTLAIVFDAYVRPQSLLKTTRRATPQIARLQVRAFQSAASEDGARIAAGAALPRAAGPEPRSSPPPRLVP